MFSAEKKKANVRKETNEVSGHESNDRAQKQKTMPPHLLSQPYHEVEVRRRKEVSKAKEILVSFFDNHADTVRKVLARDRLCEYWHPPECQC